MYKPFNSLFVSILLSLLSLFSLAQSIGVNMGFDHWGNQYRWSESELEKYDPVQQLDYRNGQLTYGKITKLDWVQPQKPFVFFEDTQRIVFLDNTLSEQGESISLSSILPNSWITQVSGSVLGGFWCYDHLNQQLIKLDQLGNFLFTLNNLPHFNLLSDWDALGLIEHKNALYLWDHQNLFVFDLLGGLTQQVSAPGDNFLFDNGTVFQYNGTRILAIFPLSHIYSKSPSKTPFCIHQHMIYVWNKEEPPYPLE